MNMNIEIKTHNHKDKDRKGSVVSIDSSMMNESEIDESSDINYKKHDANIVEYCPKIFKELRVVDELTGTDLNKYSIIFIHLVHFILS